MLFFLVGAAGVIAVGLVASRRSMSVARAIFPSTTLGFLLGAGLWTLFVISEWREGALLPAVVAVFVTALLFAVAFFVLSLLTYFVARRLAPVAR